MTRLPIQLAVAVVVAPLVAVLGGGCSQVLDISPGTLISNEAGTTLGCEPGRATCSEGKTCETVLASDPANCGSCGTVCPGDHATATCENGQCKFACAAGFADCDQSASTACETELAVTPSHCGRCGHDCFGGGCREGVCQPRGFVDSEDAVRDIGLAGATLYALASWTLSSKGLDATSSAVALGPPAFYVDGLAVGGGRAFANKRTGATVSTYTIDGTCVFAKNNTTAFAVDADALYVADAPVGASVIHMVSSTSTCAAPVSTVIANLGNRKVRSMATDADWVYWTTDDNIVWKTRKDGSTQALQWVSKSPGAGKIVASDDKFLYWTSARGLNRVGKLTQCADEALCAEFFAPDSRGPFAVDGQYVYVALEGGTKGYRVSLRDKTTGGDLGNILATEPVVAVTTDGGSIYVAAGRRVQRVAK